LYTDLVDTIKYNNVNGDFEIHRTLKTQDVNNQWREGKKKGHPQLKLPLTREADAQIALDNSGMSSPP
jgi:hypothetical protein